MIKLAAHIISSLPRAKINKQRLAKKIITADLCYYEKEALTGD